MRVAVVTTSYPSNERDPSGHFVESEVKELERSGAEVTVIKPTEGGAFGWPGVAARIRERPWRIFDASLFTRSGRQQDDRQSLELLVGP